MSPRKRNSKAGASKQSSIESYFSPKPRRGTASSTKKRLVQSSLTARPLRSRRPPVVDQDGVLDLTRSTSPPTELDSPPSSKKRKLRAATPDQSPTRGAPRDPFGSSLSPLSNRSPSPAPSPRQKSQITPARLDDKVGSMIISPSPVHARSSQSYDPNDIVESSQTQYLHLRFTPQSQRVMTTDVGHIPAPIFTPTSDRGPEPNSAQGIPRSPHSMDHSQSVFHIPSSQGEVSEPYTPRKRTRASVDRFGTPSRVCGPSNVPDTAPSSVGCSSQELVAKVPPTTRSVSVRTPSKVTPRDRSASTGASAPPFASPRPIPTPRRQFDRSSYIPSSQGEPSLEPTELGTVESPAKSAKYPGTGAEPLPRIPESVPSSQNSQGNVSRTPGRVTTPLLPISNLNQTPPPSSPTDIPSPGQLLSSMGLGVPRNADQIPPPRLVQATTPTTRAVEKRALALGFPDTPEGTNSPAKNANEPLEMDQSPPRADNESPRRSQSSSQTVIPSSQPLHDSSPPPEYDMDPQIHSFYQGQIQRRSEFVPPDQAPSAFGSRNPSDLRPTFDSNQPYFTARTHHSPMDSSQSLPPSQSPIKGGRMDPDRSAAGIQGVFGMLGFGSDAYSGEDSPMKARQSTIEEGEDNQDPHIPVTFDLPPSSPPPQTPTREESRAYSPKSRSVQSKRKTIIRNPPVHEAPLLRAFEAVRNRSKTDTPVTTRRSSNTYQTTSSPIRATHMDQPSLTSSPARGSEAAKRRTRAASQNTTQASRGVDGQTPSKRPRQVSKTIKSPNNQPSQVSTSHRSQKDVDEEVVESSDVEEAMDVEPRNPRSAMPNSSDSPTRARGPIHVLDRDDVPMEGVEPTTPTRVERLPSSVSPSPIRIRNSPPIQDTRAISPPPESSQTQEESETPWESLRPSQSVSQVFERRLIEEAMEEAERGRPLRMEQDAVRRKAKEQEQLQDQAQEIDPMEEQDEEESQQREDTPDRPPARPVMISFDPRSPTNVSANPPQLPPPRTVSTPTSRRVANKNIYIVTPTKVVKRTPVKVHRQRAAMTPSSALEEEEEDPEEYTYVDETFNPTESQQSFLDRILQGANTQME